MISIITKQQYLQLLISRGICYQDLGAKVTNVQEVKFPQQKSFTGRWDLQFPQLGKISYRCSFMGCKLPSLQELKFPSNKLFLPFCGNFCYQKLVRKVTAAIFHKIGAFSYLTLLGKLCYLSSRNYNSHNLVCQKSSQNGHFRQYLILY